MMISRRNILIKFAEQIAELRQHVPHPQAEARAGEVVRVTETHPVHLGAAHLHPNAPVKTRGFTTPVKRIEVGRRQTRSCG